MRDLCHLRSPLFIYLFLLFGRAMNLGRFVAVKDRSGVSSGNRQKKEAFAGSIWSTLWIWTGFTRLSDVIALQIRTLKDTAPEFGHSLCLPLFVSSSIMSSPLQSCVPRVPAFCSLLWFVPYLVFVLLSFCLLLVGFWGFLVVFFFCSLPFCFLHFGLNYSYFIKAHLLSCHHVWALTFLSSCWSYF